MMLQERIEITGWVGRQPQLYTTKGGHQKADLSVAVRRVLKDGDVFRNITVWHRLVAWEHMAERITCVLRKGSLAIFQIRINYRPIQVRGEDGAERVLTVPSLTICDFLPLVRFGSKTPDKGAPDAIG